MPVSCLICFVKGRASSLTGVLLESGVIEAEEVLAKHDEEYMPPELAEKMKGIKHVNPNQGNTGS